jgi:hypothetical protein
MRDHSTLLARWVFFGLNSRLFPLLFVVMARNQLQFNTTIRWTRILPLRSARGGRAVVLWTQRDLVKPV